ncbi:MAG: hypothetical protein M0C28_42140 [Candidatus Moduliflexus flocculans]|nr:hypothetical protein [Candidatus Moduliflexus flocculans]
MSADEREADRRSRSSAPCRAGASSALELSWSFFRAVATSGMRGIGLLPERGRRLQYCSTARSRSPLAS